MTGFTTIKGTVLSILKALYQYWLRFALVFGSINTVIILFVVYVLVFVAYRLVMLCLGKGLLDTKLDSSSNSYWELKTSESENREEYLKQF